MCNYYIMYWTEGNGNEVLNRKMCFSAGPPTYRWKTDSRFNNLPEEEEEEEDLTKSPNDLESTSQS